ncbi:hypothetical protein HGP28_13940 [Vibrio sp. SM6]|uniref:Uncharacterized protein n=1 Tax=Vibrio agarilyticus TaxID=2726741 RepID=A0A7X8YHW2_9VIBR|nr:hypothetical protein [Vibrio agarilyticus]NLS13990.1 hypothetical protein [Vibrio agarilyticus]
MFKNKHLLAALLIAPILSIVAYVGTDLALSEKPHAAKEGETYKLAAQSNCRYTSGLCDLKNGDFGIQFRSDPQSSGELTLSLTAKYPLQGVRVALVETPSEQGIPLTMAATDDSGLRWQLPQAVAPANDQWLQVAVQANNTLYYGDTETTFFVYQTLLDQ